VISFFDNILKSLGVTDALKILECKYNELICHISDMTSNLVPLKSLPNLSIISRTTSFNF
jgi:hypothetical protein